MLGNIAPLWEVILAAMKLGAVIIPASTLLGPADLADRIDARRRPARGDRGRPTPPSSTGLGGGWTAIAVGPGPGGGATAGRLAPVRGRRRRAGRASPRTASPGPATRCCCTSPPARPRSPSWSSTPTRRYPVGHLSTMYWIGLQPGDVHLNISSPGWAKHAWSNVFAPWNAEATVLILNYDAVRRAGAAATRSASCGVTTFCAPPTVWRMLIQADLTAADVAALRECVAAGEPLNPEVIEQVRRAWGITVRDGYGQTETTAQVGNPPGQPRQAGLDGPAAARLHRGAGRPASPASPADEGEICLDLSDRPLGADDRLPRRPRAERRGDARRLLPHRRRGRPRRRRLHHLRRPHRRRVQGVGLPDLAVRAGERADRARGGGRGGGGARRRTRCGWRCPRRTWCWPPGSSRRPRPRWRSCAYCRERLAPYKRIRRLEFAELPKTISGKIRRVELREAETSASARRARRARPRGVTEFWEEDFPGLKS